MEKTSNVLHYIISYLKAITYRISVTHLTAVWAKLRPHQSVYK